MSQVLQRALRTLADAMRDAEPPESGDDHEREVANGDVPRPMGYFHQQSAKTTQQRAANVADDDAPLTMRPVLLEKPKKREAA